MNELSLFTGAGGGVLASKLLNHGMVGYVENNEYCQKVLAQRIEDGLIDEAPIFGDIRAFNNSGYAAAYTGLVDVVSGGFPCQDISCAGKGAGITGERSGMWFEMAATIRTIRPRYVFVENSPMLTVRGLGRVFGDLARCGYNARWCVLGNHHLGGVSDGKRLWIVAFKADCPMLEGVDIFKYFIPCEEESCRREYSRAVRKALPQDDYATIERGSDELARGMERLKAIGNGQNPIVAATAFRILSGVLDNQTQEDK